MTTPTSEGATAPPFSVAVDVMGGDYAPEELVAGAVEAARQHGIKVLVVGDAEAVEAELSKHPTDGLQITLVPSQGVIMETDHPTLAMREKPRASVIEAAKLVKTGHAQAMVSLGSTGAAMATATLVLGPREGIELLDRLDGIEGMIVTKDQTVLSSRGLRKYRM